MLGPGLGVCITGLHRANGRRTLAPLRFTPHLDPRHAVPRREAVQPFRSVSGRRPAVPRHPEMPHNRFTGRYKAWGLPCGFAPPQRSFRLARRLGRGFRPVVEPFVLAMLHPRQDRQRGRPLA